MSAHLRSGDTAVGGQLYGSSIGTNTAAATVAELIGTFVLVYGGTAVAVAATLDRPVAGPVYNSLATPLAFGLALLGVVASIGHVSGAHVNPAVTIGLAATGAFPWRLVPAYVVAQIVGAVLGSLATWLTFGNPGRDEAALAATAPAAGVGGGTTFLVELLVTFVLVFAVVSVATDDRVHSRLAPVAVGAALAVAISSSRAR
ncbi:aquaporin [Pseudonocardia sp. NPDC049154]|uniref:MIP/aquaporin family protein n=1 Tax=Pseudonocardia sp. NPDC049154 TaxID=3155501 RepID=UPI0033FA6330